MKQWSGWAHTLRTKESRRKPVKQNIFEVTGKEKGNGDVQDMKKGTEEVKITKIDENEDKNEVGLIQENEEMIEEKRKINVNEMNIEIEEGGKVEKGEENNDKENGKEENVDEVEKSVNEEVINEDEDEDEDEDKDEREGEGKEIEDHTPSKEQYNINRPTNITYTDMAETGKKVKRILDHGRVKFLKNLGLNASQIKYCHPSLSPECTMIIANRQI